MSKSACLLPPFPLPNHPSTEPRRHVFCLNPVLLRYEVPRSTFQSRRACYATRRIFGRGHDVRVRGRRRGTSRTRCAGRPRPRRGRRVRRRDGDGHYNARRAHCGRGGRGGALWTGAAVHGADALGALEARAAANDTTAAARDLAATLDAAGGAAAGTLYCMRLTGLATGASRGSTEQTVLVLPGDCAAAPCTGRVAGLAQGVPAYVRVFAYNALGYSARVGARRRPRRRRPSRRPRVTPSCAPPQRDAQRRRRASHIVPQSGTQRAPRPSRWAPWRPCYSRARRCSP